MRLPVILTALVVLLSACTPNSSTTDEAAVWAAVEARNATWASDDFEAHMAIYHPDFRRWTLRTSALMNKDDFSALWNQIKKNEKTIRIDVLPVEVVFYASGKTAIAHYIIDEEYQWLGDDTVRRNGDVMRKGETLTAKFRFSDVFVKEDGSWLYAGGHRDGMMIREN